MLIQYAAITHPGRVRRNNEDAYLVSGMDGEEPLVNALRNPSRLCPAGLLAAVADGMGGAAAGEVASREGLMAMAVNLFARWGGLQERERSERVLWRALKASAEAAGQAIQDYTQVVRSSRGMGTTMTAALIFNRHAYVVQVGDSRAYLFRNDVLSQLTEDHTLVNEMRVNGLLSEEEAARHPNRNMITQALGAPQPLKVALLKVPLRRGDRLLLCSDGLHGELSERDMAAILRARHSCPHTLERMLEAVLAHGARDNVTGLLLALDDPGLPLPRERDEVEVLTPAPKDLAQSSEGLLARLGRRFAGHSA